MSDTEKKLEEANEIIKEMFIQLAWLNEQACMASTNAILERADEYLRWVK